MDNGCWFVSKPVWTSFATQSLLPNIRFGGTKNQPISGQMWIGGWRRSQVRRSTLVTPRETELATKPILASRRGTIVGPRVSGPPEVTRILKIISHKQVSKTFAGNSIHHKCKTKLDAGEHKFISAFNTRRSCKIQRNWPQILIDNPHIDLIS